jgi:hypothetical protein
MHFATTALMLIIFCLTGCQVTNADRVTEKPSNLEQLVGRQIVAEGIITMTKMPSVAGIQVERLWQFAGRTVRVRGVLRTYTITQKNLDDTEKQAGGPVASMGPGTYYYLRPLRYEILD